MNDRVPNVVRLSSIEWNARYPFGSWVKEKVATMDVIEHVCMEIKWRFSFVLRIHIHTRAYSKLCRTNICAGRLVHIAKSIICVSTLIRFGRLRKTKNPSRSEFHLFRSPSHQANPNLSGKFAKIKLNSATQSAIKFLKKCESVIFPFWSFTWITALFFHFSSKSLLFEESYHVLIASCPPRSTTIFHWKKVLNVSNFTWKILKNSHFPMKKSF